MGTQLLLPSIPDLEKRIEPRPLNRFGRRNYGSITPGLLQSILREVEQGQLENWADLCAYIVRTDAHVHAVYGTRIAAVAGAEYSIEPGVKGDPLAEQAAQFVAEQMESTPDVERTFSDMLNAVGLGWSIQEHVWSRRAGLWITRPAYIHPRECRFADDWTLEVRSADTGEYILCNDYPGKFVVHVPRPVSDVPNLTGELLAVAWEWLFKRWSRKFQLTALERFASPFIYGEVPPNSEGNVRSELLSVLQSFSTDQVAVFEAGTGVKLLEAASRGSGDAWQSAIDNINNEITKALLGSTLNTEIGASGGNRAAAESQADNTMLPRAKSDAMRLAGTVERDWFGPLLTFNAHVFGAIPPTPKLVFKLQAEELPEIDQLALTAKVVTIDELRTSRGLDPWGPEKGGADIIQSQSAPIYAYHLQGHIVSRDNVRAQLGLPPLGGALGAELLDIADAPTGQAPAFSSGGEAAASPLASSPLLSSLKGSAGTSPTFSGSRSPIVRALKGR